MTSPKKKSNNNILAVDIGGSKIKATTLDRNGNLTQEYNKVKTPDPPSPDEVVNAVIKVAEKFKNYDRISVGFPGYIKKGIVQTAPNLGTKAWKGVNLNRLISDALKRPVRTANDADMQGLGIVRGKGLEMVITLGTGFGTALLMDGNLLPHVELAHHSVTKKKTYDEYVGDKALKKAGKKKWNKRMKKIFKMLSVVFNYDVLYIGGGNSESIALKLDDNMKIITNKDGIKGGARLWQLDENLFMKATKNYPSPKP